jgi:hypothetical protein
MILVEMTLALSNPNRENFGAPDWGLLQSSALGYVAVENCASSSEQRNNDHGGSGSKLAFERRRQCFTQSTRLQMIHSARRNTAS